MRKFYSGIFTLFLLLFIASNANAQLSGTKTIPGDYATIADAVTALNAAGVGAGGVNFSVAGGHTESITAPIVITATGTAANQISFLTDGMGANPKITRTDAGTLPTSTFGGQGDGIIVLDGGDYISFVGIDVAASNMGIEYGYYLRKASATDGCKNVMITGCGVTMTKGTSPYVIGIYSSNNIPSSLVSSATGVTVTATSGRHESINITSNTISNVHSGIALRGYNHTTAPNDLMDQNFTVGAVGGANIIQNFGGGNASASHGVYIIYVNNTFVGGNTINNTAGGGTGATNTLYGVMMSAGSNASVTVSFNNINVTTGAGTSLMRGVHNESASGVFTVNSNNITLNTSVANSGTAAYIYNGTITSGMTITGNTFNGTSLNHTGTLYLIYNSNSYTTSATVQNNSVSGTIARTGASGTGYGYYNNASPTGILTLSDNNFSNITLAGTSSFNGIYSNTTGLNSQNIFNNTVSNITGGTGTITGIHAGFANIRKVYGNVIHTLSNGGTVTGIASTSGFTSGGIYKNKIYNLSSNSTAATTGLVSGITISSGTNPVVFNNLIGDLQLPNSGSADGIRGINITSTLATSTISLYHNTIYINATTAGALFGSSGVYHTSSATSTTAALEMKNNIIVNTSSPTGAGVTAAFRRSAAALENYSTASNNNLFYAGVPSASKVVYHNSVAGYQTIGDFKGQVSPRELASFTEMPPFVSTTGADPTFLHINPTIATQTESGGAPVAAVTDDYDGEARNASTPDVGADEFAGIPADFTPPAIVYTNIASSCSTGDRVFAATITDASGVATGANSPRVYYRKNSGAWFSQQGSLLGGTWTFNIVAADMGGLAIGDVVSYYVIAQDINGNVGSSPSGATAADVNTVTVHPAAPNTFTVQGPISGTYNVGVGQTYTTLTAAINAYHNSCLTGAVTFVLTDATYPSETFPITINQHVDASAVNTLTIKPNTGVNATISGSSASAIIKLNGADYVTIDGSNNGTSSRNLTLENTSTAANTAVVWVASLGTGAGATFNTIKNTNIKAGSITVSSIFGIHVGGTSISTTGSGADNDNLTLNNNAISKAYYGIYAVATAAGVNDNLTVTNNQIGSATATDYITFRGTQISQANNVLVEKNRVFNMISSNTNMRAMEFGVGVTNSLVSKNVITEINYNGTSFSAGKGMTFISGAGANITISNNMISALKGHGSSTETNNSWGIMLSDGSGYNVYYNSINISDNRTATTSSDIHGGIYISSTVSGVNLRNNIISVTGAPGNAGGRMYAVYSLVISPSSPFIVSNYNDFYVAGTQHSVGYYHGANRNTLADWQLVTVQDLNSISVQPVFVSATDLHLQINSNIALNNTGTPIGTVTTDIDDEARNATTPDMGADEFTPPPGADVGITALVAPGSNVCYTATETVSVTLRNFSANAIDFSVQPVTVNVTVSGAGTYVGSRVLSSGTLASGATMTVTMPTTFDMTANGTYTFNANTVIAGDINPANDAMTAATRTAQRLSGTYTVGVGGDFATLTAAVAAYNSANCIPAPVVFSLTDATYPSETFPITINQSAYAGVNTLTIKPAAGVNPTISGNATSIIRINGADNVIIDGSNNGTTSRNLTIENTTTTSSRAVIYISSVGTGAGSVNTTIKNTNIKNGSNTATVYGIYAAGTSISTTGTGADNDNLTIQNNSISKSYYGIYVSGTSTGTNNNLVISDNTIGSNTASDYVGYMGIQVAQTTGGTISNNTIFNIITANSVNPTGMLFGTGFTGVTIEKNIIRNLVYTATSGYGARGMDFNTGSATSNITVRNNMIANMGGDGWDVLTSDAILGIRLTGTTGGVTLQHNSVHLSGSFAGHVQGRLSAAFFVNSAVTDVTLVNNILSNRLDNNVVTNDSAYAIYSLAPASAFTTIDYNDYYVDGPAGVLGKIAGVDRPTLGDIQTGFGGNVGSVNIQPLFASASDAHLPPGLNFALDNLGTPIVSITTDIDGEGRSASTPDMGADEFTSPVCAGAVGGTAVAATATPFCNTGSTTISASGYSSGAISTYVWQSSTDNTNWSDMVGEDNPLELLTGTLNDTTYYRLKVTCNSGTAIAYSNVVTVTVNPNPVVTVAPTSAAICPGSSTTLTASGNSTSYTWSPATGLSATTGATVTASPTVTTLYTVTGTIAASGCTNTATVQVVVHPSVTASAGAAITTICNGQGTQLNASAIQNSNPIKITEVTMFRTGTGQTSPYPAGMTGADLVEISNISNSSFDISGYVISAYGNNTATPSHTFTFPAGTVIPANAVAVVNLGSGTDNAGIRYFNTTGTSDSYSSNSQMGLTVKSGGIIVDAVGLGGSATGSYTFAAGTGVTTADWTGFAPNASGLAGVRRTVSLDNNAGSDWTASGASNVQTIGSYDPGYSLPAATFTYAWTPVTGLSNPAISNPMASPTSDITYTVTATETATGCSSTANVSITVLQPPAITTQPVGQDVCPGSNVTFTVAATGAGLTYQWKKDGVDVAGETGTSITINNVSAANAGSYTVVVSGTCTPSATSNAAVLSLKAVPAITTQAGTTNACAGTSASFSVTATGEGLTYQWRKDGINITGATGSSYTIASVTTADAGSYDVVVSGTCTPSVTSTPVVLTVNTLPAITSHPAGVTTCEGTAATFNVTATGTGLTYQWRKNGTPISGATSSSFSIPAVVPADGGAYDVVVSGTCTPAATSTAATLTVQTAPVVTTQPQSQTICAGQNVTFSVVATGAGLTYQWRKNGVDIGGATGASYTITGAATTDAGNYTVAIAGTCSPATTSNAAVLTVDAAPVISQQPVSQTVCSGSNVTFSVTASGVGLTYQWYRNNTVAISGATSSSYTITGVTAGSAGQYHVVVNSSCGTSVTSTPATLTVNTPPAITVQPSSQTACLASSVTFNVTATGTSLTYQWKKNGTDIPGATSSSYTISSVTAADLGAYTVVVSGICGTPVTSAAANLGVSSTNTWLGIANSDWNNASNWCAGVPTSTSVILIPAGTPFAANLMSNGSVRDITIASTATLTIGAGGNLNVYGNVVNNGTVTATAGTMSFMGTTPQAIPALTVGNVVVNTTGGVTLGGTLTIGNALTLTNGHITLGANNLILPGGSLGSVASHIITNGTGVVTSNNINVASVIFPVGPDAASYNPVMIANGGGRNYSVRVETGLTPTLFNNARAINRTWNVSVNTAPAAAASISFGYADAHANASAVPTANMEVGRHSGTAWTIVNPGGVAPFGTAALRVVTTASTTFGPMVVSNVGGILDPTSVPDMDADITKLVLRPNVFENNTILDVNSLRSMKINWTVSDSRGRVVKTFSTNVTAGHTEHPLFLRELAGGVYFLTGETTKGRTTTLRFVKL